MNIQNQTQSCKVKNAKIWQTLILHNCLPLGEHARFTSKNVAQYLLGSRNDYNVFKFNEIKHLLLKFTPLVESLFRSKVILNYKVGSVSKTRYIKPIPPKDKERLQEWTVRMKNVKIAKHNKMFYYKTLTNKRPVKILFASTNPTYAEIIKTSAGICQMNASTNRWLCGFITANSQYLGQQLKVQKKLNTFVSNSLIARQFEKTFIENKEAKEKRYNWHNLNTLTQRPAIAIIPDVINNDMILRETFAKNIPVIGLVNSNESTRIAYPIFGNSNSVQIINFFCNFLAILIAKTFIQVEYKQASHRIFNRTRAFFNNKKKKTVNTSVDTISKTKILAKTRVFPWIKKHFRNKKNPNFFLEYSKNDTRNAIKKSLQNLAQVKFRTKYKRIIVAKNNQDNEKEKVIITTNKLRYVGQQPYWKNIKGMIYLLTKFSVPRKNSFAWRKQRTWKNKEKRILKSYNMKKNKITSEGVAKMINLKQQKHNLANTFNVENYLIEKYTKKFNNLKQKQLINSLKKSLNKNTKKYFRQIKFDSKEIAKAGRIESVLPVRKPIFYKLTDWWRISKKHKLKALVKIYGHKNIVRKRKRKLFQWRIKNLRVLKRIKQRKEKFKKWHQRKKTKNKVIPFKRNTKVIERIIGAIVKLKTQRFTNWQKTKTFSNIYRSLKRRNAKAKKLTGIYKKRKLAKFLKSTLRSPRLVRTMVKNYPYYTLLVKNLMNNKKPALSKNAFNILSYELTNKKNNPYKFSWSKLYRQQKISNTMLWRKLYFQNWVIKWKKKRFAQIPRRFIFFKLDKIKRRGLIGRSKPNNKYYFKRLQFLSNSKKFPRFIKKIRKSANKTILKRSILRRRSIGYYHKKLRRFIFKFRRFHYAMPKTAHRYMPWRKNYRNRYKKKKHKAKFQNRTNWKYITKLKKKANVKYNTKTQFYGAKNINRKSKSNPKSIVTIKKNNKNFELKSKGNFSKNKNNKKGKYEKK